MRERSLTDVVLVYPYFQSAHEKSIFRSPPLGLGYLASYLRSNGVTTKIVDGTFIKEEECFERVVRSEPAVVGVYSMYTMEESSLRLAKRLRDKCDLLVAGGPLPTILPGKFLQSFDVVVVGEGEHTMLEVVRAFREGEDFSKVRGVAYKKAHATSRDTSGNEEDLIVRSPARPFVSDIDSLPFPARDLFENDLYMAYHRRKFGKATASMMTSRGCPFSCDFCSKPVFGNTIRMRSAENVVDEIEDILSYGYDSIFFQDDCFTLDYERVCRICDEVMGRGLSFSWSCLSRVDSVRPEVLGKMRKAGCERVFFGIESGNDAVLKIMRKEFTTGQARKAVELAASAGVKPGAFFMLGYPGETDQTVLDTIRFATSLPLDYLSFTVPYPIPGTGLYEKVKNEVKCATYAAAQHGLVNHSLVFESSFSETKLKFAIVKAAVQFRARKHLRNTAYNVLGKPFEASTNLIFRALK